MKKLIVKQSIEINAPASRVWKVLTSPEFTKQFMFGCEAVSSWKVGDSLEWKGSMNGKEVIFVKGNIVKINPEKLLEYTTFDPNAGIKDSPENYLAVTCKLTPVNGKTLLAVTQGDFAKVVNSEKRYNETLTGWSSVLPKIKDLAEKA